MIRLCGADVGDSGGKCRYMLIIVLLITRAVQGAEVAMAKTEEGFWKEHLECPYCGKVVQFCGDTTLLGEIETPDKKRLEIDVTSAFCTDCNNLVAILHLFEVSTSGGEGVIINIKNMRYRRYIVPSGCLEKNPPAEVPEEYCRDYIEARLILEDSPQAAAALGRRILQHLIREKAGIRERTLDREIQKIVEGGSLPSFLTESLDAVRALGNIAAHPTKNEVTGEILPVTYEEAAWTLDTIEKLFDFYFVQPAILARKRNALNSKLDTAGKPPLK